jgi:uncharacterized PurR-regulated membrane protein YhhQ (DUF165 family)
MKLTTSLTAYITSIVAANYLTSHYGLVPVGFGLLVTAGTFAAGAALLLRDFVHRYGGYQWALAGIAAGAVLSWLLADPFIALASTVAFTAAELVDLLVFIPTRNRSGFTSAALISNIISTPIDTILFLWIAGFPLTFNAVEGQFIGKVVWATLIPLAFYVVGRRAVLRQSVRV